MFTNFTRQGPEKFNNNNNNNNNNIRVLSVFNKITGHFLEDFLCANNAARHFDLQDSVRVVHCHS
jgi:hypothetical protein